MKIGYLYSFQVLPLRGGNHIHAFQLIKRFQDAGNQVCTIGDSSVPQVTTYEGSEAGVSKFLAAIDVLYVRIDGRFLTNDLLLKSAICDTNKPIVWEINSPANESLAFSWLGGDRPSPSGLWAIADYVRRSFHAARKLPAIIREERLRRKLASRSSAAICVSNSLANYASTELGFTHITVVPNGSDHQLNSPTRQPAVLPDRLKGKFNILYAGSPIYPWQGLDLIKEFIRSADQKYPNVGFILLANQSICDVQSFENVAVYESVPYEEVGAYVVAADACLAIFREFEWSKWGFHGSPTKLFDYMACGRAVLASSVGQVKEVITHNENGLLVENTVADLEKNLQHLISNPATAKALGIAARETVVSRYNWDQVADDTLRILHKVVGQ